MKKKDLKKIARLNIILLMIFMGLVYLAGGNTDYIIGGLLLGWWSVLNMYIDIKGKLKE